MLRALDSSGIDWTSSVDSDSDRTLEATVAADLGVQALLEGTLPPHLEMVDHGGALPQLPQHYINFYAGENGGNEVYQTLARLLRQAFGESQAKPRLKVAG